MTTLHLGVEELIARQHVEAMERSVRHTWHFTEFWRPERHPQVSQSPSASTSWAGELVELSITQARWAIV
jgi:hypothetical protein